MTPLIEYVLKHTERGECNCGQCSDRGDKPDPDGHTVDLGFFKVAAKDNPNDGTFISLTRKHQGEFGDCNPLDGCEHSYIELGGWIGDQGLAMQYMGLGVLLGVFKLLPPAILGIPSDDPVFKQMLGAGFLSIQVEPKAVVV
jgi:hypothetical protein